MGTAMYVCNVMYMHTCATTKLESHRTVTVGSKTPEEGAQRQRAALNYHYYYYTTVGPKRHQGHRRTHRRVKRDTEGTGGHSGGSREAPIIEDLREQRGDRRRPQSHKDPKRPAYSTRGNFKENRLSQFGPGRYWPVNL